MTYTRTDKFECGNSQIRLSKELFFFIQLVKMMKLRKTREILKQAVAVNPEVQPVKKMLLKKRSLMETTKMTMMTMENGKIWMMKLKIWMTTEIKKWEKLVFQKVIF